MHARVCVALHPVDEPIREKRGSEKKEEKKKREREKREKEIKEEITGNEPSAREYERGIKMDDKSVSFNCTFLNLYQTTN